MGCLILFIPFVSLIFLNYQFNLHRIIEKYSATYLVFTLSLMVVVYTQYVG